MLTEEEFLERFEHDMKKIDTVQEFHIIRNNLLIKKCPIPAKSELESKIGVRSFIELDDKYIEQIFWFYNFKTKELCKKMISILDKVFSTKLKKQKKENK